MASKYSTVLFDSRHQELREQNVVRRGAILPSVAVTLRKYANNEIRLNLVPVVSRIGRKSPGDATGSGATIRPLAATRGGAAPHSTYCPESQRDRSDRGGWGTMPRRSKLTPYARHLILQAGQVLEDLYGLNMLFLTGTLPGSTDLALATIACYSGYISNRITQWIRRRLPDADWLYVWEWQKRGALHIHLVVATNDWYMRERIQREWHGYWITVLKELSVKSEVDLFSSGDGQTWSGSLLETRAPAELVRKSPAGYLAKYVSKSWKSGMESKFHCPGRWWSCSYNLLFRVKQAFQFAASAKTTYITASHWFVKLASPIWGNNVGNTPIFNPWLNMETGIRAWFARSKVDEVWKDCLEILKQFQSLNIQETGSRWSFQLPLFA